MELTHYGLKDFLLMNQYLTDQKIGFLPLLVLRGKKTFLGLHGNQQFAMSSKIKYLGLLYLQIYLKLFQKLKVLLLEIDDDLIPETYRFSANSKYIIPHPIMSEVKPRLQPGERLDHNISLKIGVVGMIRPDKPIAQIIEKIQEYIKNSPNHCELAIGTPFNNKPAYLDQIEALLYDTTRQEDYFKVLQMIDILVVHYDKERYYYRASGVISDAGSCGCYIIASDYPVIKNQVNYPVSIGATFSSFDQIGDLIDQAIVKIKDQGQDHHWQWREARSAEAIAKILFSSEI
jgi:glycosyltransferase involved in cell wall biosynthesis